MAGPEVLNPSKPLEAVAYLTPHDPETLAAPFREPFHSQEYNDRVYNLHDPVEAESYLVEVHDRDITKIRGEFDARTGFHLAVALQKEKRAAVFEDGEHENVAEHSHFLTTTTVLIALAERSDLDPGLVSIKANFHDLVVEAYGGDTPIHDRKALATKEEREAAGMTLFLNDIGFDHPLSKIMMEYEAEVTPEDRFVKGMDKVVAYQFSLATKAALHRQPDRMEQFEDVVATALPKAVIDPTAFELMKGVLKELGRMWHKWGCVPFDGDPNEIVDNIARHVKDDGAEIIELPAALEAETSSEGLSIVFADVKQFPLRGLVEAVDPSERRIVEPAVLKQMGVGVIGKLLHNDKPEPPSPTPMSAFAIAA